MRGEYRRTKEDAYTGTDSTSCVISMQTPVTASCTHHGTHFHYMISLIEKGRRRYVCQMYLAVAGGHPLKVVEAWRRWLMGVGVRREEKVVISTEIERSQDPSTRQQAIGIHKMSQIWN
jgi:hypothetical protein